MSDFANCRIQSSPGNFLIKGYSVRKLRGISAVLVALVISWGFIHSCLFVPATAWSFDVLQWQPMTTLALAFAKDLPIPRPMPLPPHGTNAVLFAKSCITDLLPCFALSVRSLFLHRGQVPGERARNHFCLLRCPEQDRAFVLHRVEEPQNTHSFSVP